MPNALGVNLIDDKLSYLVGNKRDDLSRIEYAKIHHNLNKFNWEIPVTDERESINIQGLEKLIDCSAMEFIERAGNEDFSSMKSALIQFFKDGLVERPDEISIQPGWTRYEASGLVESVAWPLEKIILCDCETLVQLGGYPIMAGAYTNQAWYLWLHPSLMPNSSGEFKPELIPMGYNKLIVNFAVKFDTGKMAETYDLGNTNFVFDLQSAHIAVCGMSSKQRDLFRAYLSGSARHHEEWFTNTSANSLIDTYNLHVRPRVPLKKSAKDIRNIFVIASGPQIIKDSLDRLIQYTLDDVEYTYKLGQVLLPKYFNSNPHIATFAGHLILNQSLLPVQTDWKKWIAETDKIWAEKTKELEQMLCKIAKDFAVRFRDGKLSMAEIRLDPWLNCLDWTPAKSGKNTGMPMWWRKSNPVGRVTTKSRVAPYLLGLKIHDTPLVFIPKKAWCYEVNGKQPGAFQVSASVHPLGKAGWFMRVPHKKGSTQNVGNPLGKDYIAAFEDGVMTARNEESSKFMKLASNLTYWTAVRKRVFEQISWPLKGTNMLAIEPQLAAHGTTSRRCVERLWLTLSSAGYDSVNPRWCPGATGEEEISKYTRTKPYPKVGAELKSRVQAPEGWVFVGADFDQQEMKIASGYSDAYEFMEYGATSMGITTIMGDKKKKTDNHSLLADFLGVVRDIAKTMNFQMLYLCGVKALISAIKKVRADWDDAYCEQIAKKAIKLRRGTKDRSTKMYKGGTDSAAYNFMLRLGNAKRMPGHLSHLQAQHKLPRTPMLGSAMSSTITEMLCANNYLTSRANWGIQSSGGDILHCAILVFNYLAKYFEVPSRFMFSIHDEAWFLVKKGFERQAAALLQLTSLVVWSAFFGQLGFESLPESYAWFSAVNVDTCLRKEVYMSQVTVSNLVDVPTGYELNPGECADILNGMLSKL